MAYSLFVIVATAVAAAVAALAISFPICKCFERQVSLLSRAIEFGDAVGIIPQLLQLAIMPMIGCHSAVDKGG